MSEYIIAVHPDAHEPAEEEYRVSDGVEALNRAVEEARSLFYETAEFSIAEAGNDELFEVYPDIGSGTVVVSKE